MSGIFNPRYYIILHVTHVHYDATDGIQLPIENGGLIHRLDYIGLHFAWASLGRWGATWKAKLAVLTSAGHTRPKTVTVILYGSPSSSSTNPKRPVLFPDGNGVLSRVDCVCVVSRCCIRGVIERLAERAYTVPLAYFQAEHVCADTRPLLWRVWEYPWLTNTFGWT